MQCLNFYSKIKLQGKNRLELLIWSTLHILIMCYNSSNINKFHLRIYFSKRYDWPCCQPCTVWLDEGTEHEAKLIVEMCKTIKNVWYIPWRIQSPISQRKIQKYLNFEVGYLKRFFYCQPNSSLLVKRKSLSQIASKSYL